MKGLTAKENKDYALDKQWADAHTEEPTWKMKYYRKLARCRRVIDEYLRNHNAVVKNDSGGCRCSKCADARKLLKGVKW